MALSNNGAGPDDAEDRRVRELFDGWAERHAARHRRGFLGWLGLRDWRAMVELLVPAPGQRALDVGCGSGLYVRALQGPGAPAFTLSFTGSNATLFTSVVPRLTVIRIR